MSQVYSTEPATTGRVVIETTLGSIDVNLWCKECPTTCRTFLQLCLDGYYDGMIFHRILSEFLIQTGLTHNASMAAVPSSKMDTYLKQSTAVPTNYREASMTGDLLGWERKKLEVNPRIRFNHRGQVAAAFPLEESSETKDEESSIMLRYQFFVTLDEAPFLDAKHVAFGTVAGSTMFNALRIGRIDADDQTGIPSDMDAPPRIKSIRIDHHPFDDLVKTAEVKIPWKGATTSKDGKGGGDKQTTVEKRRKKRKGKRDLNVLSFGDEERDMEATSNNDQNRSNMLSSHDLLSKESEFLSSNVDEDVHKKAITGNVKDGSNTQGVNVSRLEKKPKIPLRDHVTKPVADSGNGEVKLSFTKSSSVESSKAAPKDERRGEDESKKQRKSKVSAVEARRAKYLKSSSGRKKRESDTMAKLFQFKSKVIETKGALRTGSNSDSNATTDNSLAARMAKRAKQSEEDQERRKQEEEDFRSMPGYSGKVNDDQAETETSDWMNTKFKCKQHIDGDKRLGAMDKMDAESKGGDGRSMDEYVVLDEKRRGKKSHRKRERHEETNRRRA